jgi:hypothetical protein
MNGSTAFGEQQVAELTPMAGWTFAYNVNADLVTSTVAGSGDISGSAGFAVLSTTAATDSSAKIETKLPVRYIPGQGALIRFACLFTEGVEGSTQIIGVGDDNDGFFFGYNGATFGVMRRYDGTDNWTPITDWEYAATGSYWINALDFTKGNVFQIQFQWLGSGEIKFFIENKATGGFEQVNRIEFANANTTTSILNPTLPIMAEVANTTNDSAIVLKTASAMGFCEGKVENPPPPHPLALPRTLTASDTTITTEHNLLTLSNQATWQSKTNRIRAQVRTLSVATDGSKPAIVRLIKDTTLGGTPSYSDYSANTSPIQYDTAGTTITGGTVVFSATLDKVDSQIFDIDRWGVFLAPGEKLTLSVQSSVATDATAAINWVDLI